jgi:hypothetical protein
MKKFLVLMVLVAMILSAAKVNAQDSKMSLGAGLNYATDIENIGISLQGLYKIDPQWEVSPKFTYYFKKDYTTYSSLDLDGHYVFSDKGSNVFYALAGLNITFFKYKYDGPSYSDNDFSSEYDESDNIWGDMGDLYDGLLNLDYKDNELGINVGVGGRFSLSDALDLNAEVKYTSTYSGYLSIGAGLLYQF